MVAITHEYVIAVERICEQAEMSMHPRFMALFSDLGSYFIILWPNIGISGKLILFHISFRRPEVLKITAKMGVGLDIYPRNPNYIADRSYLTRNECRYHIVADLKFRTF